ncbi:MAG: tRNA pseudouridine(38-40) synthase TruA [Chloroflexota bacterium]
MNTYNVRAIVAYDGTLYQGFQRQRAGATIQGELERALQRLTQSEVRVAGAGRTDAGVHAYGQVISFRTAWAHGLPALQRAMNAVLPPAIAVRELAETPDAFHARYSARSRTYVYSLYVAPVRMPWLDRFAWHVGGPLDLAAMQAAAAALPGEHDLAAFGQAPGGENTVRRVHQAFWSQVGAPPGQWEPEALLHARFRIEANAFLRGMVRRIVGTLLLVGSGQLSPQGFRELMCSREIRRAAPPAAPRGLALLHVRYEDDALDAPCRAVGE